jgi:hypothetical protein
MLDDLAITEADDVHVLVAGRNPCGIEDLAQGGGKGIGFARLAIFAAKETAMSAWERHGFRPDRNSSVDVG